jgi:hypothetical protein
MRNSNSLKTRNDALDCLFRFSSRRRTDVIAEAHHHCIKFGAKKHTYYIFELSGMTVAHVTVFKGMSRVEQQT